MIRPAVVGDIPRLLEIGKQFHTESRYAEFGIDFDGQALAESLDRMLASEDGGVFVSERSGFVGGVAAVVLSTPFMSRRLIAIEPFWWMHPDLRGSMDSIHLILALERWTAERGCVALSMVELELVLGSPAAAIYRRLGYQPAERTWIKKVKLWQQ